jgi:transcriptional regulator of acetoin/glycerol metabolism
MSSPHASLRGDHVSWDRAHELFRRTLILDALAGAKWNISLAARRLDVSRSVLYAYMREHGIKRPVRT